MHIEMLPIKKICSLVTIVLLSGCASIVDHSSSEDFTSTLGKRILIKDIKICVDDPVRMKGGRTIRSSVWNSENSIACIGGKEKLLGFASKGQVIKISRIEEHRKFDLFQYQHWFAFGTIEVEDKEHEIYYFLGITTNSHPKLSTNSIQLWR